MKYLPFRDKFAAKARAHRANIEAGRGLGYHSDFRVGDDGVIEFTDATAAKLPANERALLKATRAQALAARQKP